MSEECNVVGRDANVRKILYEAAVEIANGEIGFRDAIRILKRCRRATEHIVVPKRKRDVRPYVEQCVPIVTAIVIEEMEAELPEE